MAENLDNNEENIDTEETTDEAKVTPEIDSKYRLILLAAQRSKQLQKGANPRVNADPRRTKSTRIALEEFKQKKIHFEFIDEEK
ncbi:MAG TPA: DNA-directed RNA polymerase subunit omega [Pyrinomonadaceae bacterium]|jgi:DNA-directed RNA polymerase subunit omega